MENFNIVTGKNQNKRITGSIIKCFILIIVLFFSKANFAADYYWVGGSGNWSNINHWATTSGGVITHLQVPTAFDDVHFDMNSFSDTGQVVTINAGNYVCKSMDWTGALNKPTFNCLNGYSMSIYGSFILIPNMKFLFNGGITFESTNLGNQIKTSGHNFKNWISFTGVGGEWNIMDNLNVNGYTIYLYNGTLRTNNNNITCRSFSSGVSATRGLFLGSSIITTEGWVLYSSGLTFNCGTSTININTPSSNFSSQGTLVYNNLNINDSTGMASINSVGTSTFNNVKINSNSNIFGSNIFNNLNLRGKYYILQAGYTTTILNNLITNGTCASRVFLTSSTDSVFSIITKNSGNISVDYFVMKDVHASGGASFVANNSVNLGNNNGWTINVSAPSNLYWVGGSGNWNDPNHWSFVSGGAGGACVPTAYDNVFFDSQSFTGLGQYVNINVVNAFCKSIDWTGSLYNPLFKNQMGCNLYVYGSWTFIANMTNSFNGIVAFMSQSLGNTIKSATQQFNNNVYFDGYHGGWSLMDDFSTGTSNIFFNKGSLITNNNGVKCNSFIGSTSFDRTLLLGSSIITVTSNSSSAWTLNQTHLTFNSGTSTIIFTNKDAGISNSATDTLRYYDVTFLNNLGAASIKTNSGVSKFNRMKVNCNGIITGNNVYKSLRLNSKYYVLEVNKAQTILDSLALNSNCSSNTFIYSSLDGTQATLRKSSGNVTVQYVILKDINANGGALFTANNSIDFGNNSGWTINLLANSDLYWVGGSGNWDDPNHWSYTSGGAGGACIPMPTTNVFFDQNSFSGPGQYCNINIIFAFCHNMTWNGTIGNPELKGQNINNLRIFGSLYFENNMANNFMGPIYFEALHSGHQLRSANKVFSNSVSFIGVGGEWTFLDDFNSLNSIYLFNGKLIAPGKNITCYNFSSSSQTYRKLDITSSTVILKSTGCSWGVSGNNFVLSANNSLIKVTKPSTFSSTPNDSLNYFNVFFEDPSSVSCLTNSTYPTTFRTVIFKGDGLITGKNIFDTLTFFPSRTYTLGATQTQYVIKQFNCTGNGCFPIKLRSTSQGTQSSISKASGMVSVGYVDMRDQNATGGASFYAGDFSTNVANNTGWVFGVAPGYTYGFPDTLYVCPNDSITLNVQDVFTICQYSIWQDNTISNLYTITTPGKYWVRVVFANNCYYVDTITVLNSPLPTANAGSDVTICEGGSTSLMASGNLGSTYLWNTGDTTAAINVHPVVTTTYSVSVHHTCGIAVDNVIVHVNQLPQITINAGIDTTVCPSSNFILSVHGSNLGSYHWSTNQNTQSITANTTSQAVYSVTVTDNNNCGTATDAITVNVFPLPQVSLGNDYSICVGGSTTITATGTNIQDYIWSNNAITPSINVSPNSNTTYTVTVSDIMHCGIATDAITISLVTIPIVDAGSNVTICSGTGIDLSANSLNSTGYLWNTGQPLQTINVNPTVTTIYTVTASNACGTASDNITVNVNPLPIVQINSGNDTLVCPGSNFTLIANGSNIASYHWSTSQNSHSITTSTNISTVYTVTVTDHYNCGTATDAISVNVQPQPIVTLGNDISVCSGSNAVLHATGSNIHDYLWSTGEVSATIIVSPLANTTYYVTVSDNMHCSTATDAIVLSVSPLPTVNAGSDQTICFGNNTDLYADGLNATGYSWSNGQNTQTINVSPTSTTNYIVTASNSCGTATDEVMVMINDTLHFTYSVIDEACDKSNGMIIAGTNNQYLWSNGASTPTISNLSTGNYTVTVTHNDCSSTETVFVGNIPGPHADFTVNSHKMTLGDGPFVFTDASQNAVAWFWAFGDGTTSSAQNPKHSYAIDGTYNVSLTVIDANDCSDTKVDEVVVNIYDGFATPNAFTPNGDGLNDQWGPIKLGEDNVIKYELFVYDRWGKLIFETDNVNNLWNGTDAKGRPYSEGVYTYLFNYEISTYDNYKQTGTKIGQVTLLN